MRKVVYLLIILAAVLFITLRPETEMINTLEGGAAAEPYITPVATPTPVPTPTPTPTPVPTPTPTPTPTPYMVDVNALYDGLKDSNGSKEIARLQNRLEELGYYTGALDGVYSTGTADAVSFFQKENNLTVTGVADVYTIRLIYSEEAIADPLPSPTPMVAGSTGEEVKKLQQRLRLLGFLSGDADGSYGDKTSAAILLAQEYIHAREAENPVATATPAPTEAWMTPSPTPTFKVNKVLDEKQGKYVNETTPSPTPTIRFTPTPAPWTADGSVTEEFIEKLFDDNFVYYAHDVANGDKDSEARRIQNRLVVLGYMKKSDGVFGAGTERALKYFQYKNGLKETGVADLKTQSKLFSVDAVQSDTVVTLYKITVDTTKQRTFVYKWNEHGFDTEPVKTFICSTGKDATPTPKGEYWATGPYERWHYFKDFDCWAQYAWTIDGGPGILFHSVIYASKNENSLQTGSVRNLGKKASHGCVRLKVADAEWIYRNCPGGTPVTVV